MSEKIDWSKAPKWATRLMRNKYECPNAWADDHKDAIWVTDYESGPDMIFNLDPTAWDLIENRPTTPSWSGEGLPQVGVVCELRCLPVGGWGKAEIKYMSPTMCVWLWLRDDGGEQIELAEAPCVTRMAFRPIRTPEQIAADEREAAVNGMLCYDALGGSRRGLAEALYDAGFRKP